MGKFKFGSSDHLNTIDENKNIAKANSIDRSIILKKISDKQKLVLTNLEKDEKMAEDLMAQFVKIIKERNELRAQVEAKNTDLLSISQELVTLTI